MDRNTATAILKRQIERNYLTENREWKQWEIEDKAVWSADEMERFGIRRNKVTRYVSAKIGMPGDEGTLAEAFSRDTFFCTVGERGRIQSYDGEKWRDGIHTMRIGLPKQNGRAKR